MAVSNLVAPSSGPSLAEITTAIQTYAAPSSVTNASIATQVANNATPFGGTWTNVAYSTFSNVNTTTITGLTGYKHLRVIASFNTVPANEQHLLRFNGDTGNNYWYGIAQGTGSVNRQIDQTYIIGGANPGYGGNLMFEILNANSTSAEKIVNMRNNNNNGAMYGYAHWRSYNAITSITTYTNGGGNFTGAWLIMGAN